VKHFQNILVFADALAKGQWALKRVVGLTKQNNAALKVIDVAMELPTYMRLLLQEQATLTVGQRRHKLESLARDLHEQGVAVATEVLIGRPFLEVTRQVLRGGHDLLVKDAERAPDHKRLLAGSIDMRLLRNCPCPVWLVKTKADSSYKRIVAAVDPTPSDAAHRMLNSEILEVASSLATFDNAELYVVGAWEIPGEVLLSSRVSADRFMEFEKSAHSEAKKEFKHTLESSGIQLPQDQLRFRHGEAAPTITEFVKEIGADLLVMGTVARTGISGLLMGNTAERVLHDVECSVLTMKPAGFASPDRLDENAATRSRCSSPLVENRVKPKLEFSPDR